MASSSCPAADASCFLTKGNRDRIQDLICQLRHLGHKLQCSSTRAKGDTTACFSAGEVTAQQMTNVVEDLDASVRQLKEDLKMHLTLHELHGLRVHRGRADRDSGVISWTADIGVPIQEEVGEGEVEVPSSSGYTPPAQSAMAENVDIPDAV